MAQVMTMAVLIFCALAALAYFSELRRAASDAERGHQTRDHQTPVYALLPGDIKYQSPSGNVRVYFPITTSIVLSIVVSLLLRFLS